MLKRLPFILALLMAFALAAHAQEPPPVIDSYALSFYAPGASQPIQAPTTFTAAQRTCGLEPDLTPETVNPTTVEWTDPDSPGMACRIDMSAVLVAFPIGNYEGTLKAANSAGESAESNRAAFSRAVQFTPPAAVTEVQLIKGTQ